MTDLHWLREWTELVSSADTVAEFGRKLVHSQLTAPTAVGAHVYGLDARGQMELMGGYGLNPFEKDSQISAWDEHLLAKSLRDKALGVEERDIDGRQVFAYAIAIMKGDEPLGVALFTQTEAAERTYSDDMNASMSQVLGMWLQSLGLTNGFSSGNGPSTQANPEALTERQLKILELIAAGKTNAEIASELILSESSIRQETVKIYRSLGVGSRSEAARRALHLGILRSAVI